MAEDGLRAARQDGGHAPAIGAQDGVADGIHAAVDPMQPSPRGPLLRATGTEADGLELRQQDDPVLARGELGERPVGAWR
jgi:hypothetical protein